MAAPWSACGPLVSQLIWLNQKSGSLLFLFLLPFKKSSPKVMLIDFRERVAGGEKERERNIDTKEKH